MPTDEVAGHAYTHGHHDSVLRSHRWRTAANSAAYLLPHLEPGMSILDVGCGPGTVTVDLAAYVAPGRVVGVDTSTDVLEQALEHAHEVLEEATGTTSDVGGASTSNVSFAAGDLYELEQETAGQFDVVHAHQVLQHLPDPVGALRAMASLARPGGLVAVRDAGYSSMFWAPDDERLNRWLEVICEVTRRNRGHPDAGRHVLAWARAAGLRDLDYTTSTWTFVSPEDRAWWGDLWAERTVASSLAEQAQSYGIATPTELAGLADAWRAWATHPDAMFVVVHGEILARVG